MRNERIEEIRTLCGAATPEQWHVTGAFNQLVAQKTDNDTDMSTIVAEIWKRQAFRPNEGKGLSDAKFIAASRQIVPELLDELTERNAEIEKLKTWVNDLHSGMYVNCVYCGHRYGKQGEVNHSMADVLKKHIENCPKHPMSKLKAERDRLAARAAALERAIKEVRGLCYVCLYETQSPQKSPCSNCENKDGDFVNFEFDEPRFTE